MNTTAKITVTAINRGVGEIQIHKAGCRDLKRNIRGASIWSIEAASHEDVIRDVFSDMIGSGEGELDEYLGGVEYANCLKRLPSEEDLHEAERDGELDSTDTEIKLPAPTSRKNSKQAEIILTFLAQHAGTAYTPHQISVAMGHKGLRDACARLARQGVLIKVSDKPVSYKIAG